ICDQYRKDRSKECGVDLGEQCKSACGTVVGQDPRAGTYCQDTDQDNSRLMFHLECIHKGVCRRDDVTCQVGGQLCEDNERQCYDHNHLVVNHLCKCIDRVCNACSGGSHGSDHAQKD